MGQELLQGVAQQHGVGVAEDQDFALGLGHQLVEHAGLAAAVVEGHQLHVRGMAGHDGIGGVGGAVGPDEHLEVLLRELQVHAIPDLLLDDRLLVVGGDDHGDLVTVGIAQGAAAAEDEAQQGQGERVHHIGVDQEAREDPEEDGHQEGSFDRKSSKDTLRSRAPEEM
jgi:hypothetical protein